MFSIYSNVQTYRLDGDKGFNFSQIDKAFVCQKKNHFQITSCLSFSDGPQYVMSSEGPKQVEGFFMHFYGVKVCISLAYAHACRRCDVCTKHPQTLLNWATNVIIKITK